MSNIEYELIKSAVSVKRPNGKSSVKMVRLDIALKIANKFDERSISWAAEDFAQRAEEEEGDDWRDMYDESKFDNALLLMIKNHDCNNGITWTDIDHYLETYCKK